jgi:AcrR family transcriptional regulator
MSGAPQPDRVDRELDDLIQAVLDGATDAATREALFARIEVDPEARERLRQMRGVFEQLGHLRRLPLPLQTTSADVTMPSTTATTSPSFRSRRLRQVRGARARWALLAVAAAAGAAFVLIGPSRELLRDSWRGVAGTVGLQTVPVVAHWQAHDVEVRLGALRDEQSVQARAHIEAKIPGTVTIAFDSSLWRVREVEISGSGAGWASPEPGSIQVSVVREIDVVLTLEPLGGASLLDVITLHLRAGDDATTQLVPIGARGRSTTNFPTAGR